MKSSTISSGDNLQQINEKAKENQKFVAVALKKLILNQSHLEKFDFFELKIISPKFIGLEIQTRERLEEFILTVQKEHPSFLQDLDVEDSANGVDSCILRNQRSEKIESEIHILIDRIKQRGNLNVSFS